MSYQTTKTIVTIIAEAPQEDSSPRYHGVAYDGDLPPDFAFSQPKKCKWFCAGIFSWDEILDTKEGDIIEVVYGNDADPSAPWYAGIFINDELVAEGYVDKDHFLAAPPYTVTSRTTQPVKLAFLTYECLTDIFLGEPKFSYPGFIAFNGCTSWYSTQCPFAGEQAETWYPISYFDMTPGHLFGPDIHVRPYVNDIYETEPVLGCRSRLWVSIVDPKTGKEVYVRDVFTLHPSQTCHSLGQYSGYATLGISISPFFAFSLNDVPPELYVEARGGYYDENGNRIQTDTLSIPLRRMADCHPPQPPFGTVSILEVTMAYDVPHDVQAGRYATAWIKIKNTSSTYQTCPVVAVFNPDGEMVDWFPYPSFIDPGFDMTMILPFRIDSSIGSKGYLIVKAGHMEANIGAEEAISLPALIWDSETTVPITSISAKINPPLQYSTYTPAIAARINPPLTYSTYKPPVAAKINPPLGYSTYTPPSPPPPQYATLKGRVTSILGPVGGAEVRLNRRYLAITNADGTFRIENIALSPRPYTLTVTPTSFLQKILLQSASRQISISEAKEYEVDITLNPNYPLIGASIGAIAAIAYLARPKAPPEYYAY